MNLEHHHEWVEIHSFAYDAKNNCCPSLIDVSFHLHVLVVDNNDDNDDDVEAEEED